MTLGVLPSRRVRPPPPTGPPPPPPTSAPPSRHHWKSLAGLEIADMAAKNIKGSISRAFGLKSNKDKTSPSSSSESSSIISRWSRPSPPRTRSHLSIGNNSLGCHPAYSSFEYDSTYESPHSIYESPLNCNEPPLSYRVNSQHSINSNIYSNGSHCFDISELDDVSHRTNGKGHANNHRVSSPLPIHEEIENPVKQKKHRRVKSISDIEAAATLPI